MQHARAMTHLRAFLLLIVANLTACSGADSPASTSGPTEGHRFEFASADGRFVGFWNEAMVLRPSLSPLVQAKEGRDFGRIYNRLPCQETFDQQPLDDARNAALATHGFEAAPATFAAERPVFLASLSVELPDAPNEQPGSSADRLCYAYRTTDGVWHGHFDATPTIHDAAAGVRRITFAMNAAHVDMIGVVTFASAIGTVSLVSRAE
jgi:hypothetical protein